jgi:aspartate-semialdehyde dehydrogenase
VTDRPIAVVGATGAVGRVALQLLRERGYENVRAFASERSAGREVDGLTIEEATPEALENAGVDIALFAIGTDGSRELVPHAVRGGATVVDKSSAYRLQDGVPLVVPEVNGDRALENDGVVANPNCSSIPLTCVLKPLHEAAGLARVRLSTYQAVSGAGTARMEELRSQEPAAGNLSADWDFDGEEFDEEAKIRAESRKILELPGLPISATCVRVPIMVGHSESIWIETEQPLRADAAREILAEAPSVRLVDFPNPCDAAVADEVLVGRIRADRAAGENSLALFLSCDNLRKGAALNAIQIAELLLARRPVAA